MVYKNPVPTSQRTLSITKMNQLMPFSEKKLLFILRIVHYTVTYCHILRAKLAFITVFFID